MQNSARPYVTCLKRKRHSKPNLETSDASPIIGLVYFKEGTRRIVERDWLQKNAFKSVSRDWTPALWTSFEIPRLFAN